MTRMILTLMLLGPICAVSSGLLQADVLLIEEVRQSERLELPDGLSAEEYFRELTKPKL